MAINTNPSSRRALLAGTAAGLAVAAAGQLARPLSALAADGDPVLVGQAPTRQRTTTSITNTATDQAVLDGREHQGVGNRRAAAGTTGSGPTSRSWIAVEGDSHGEVDRHRSRRRS